MISPSFIPSLNYQPYTWLTPCCFTTMFNISEEQIGKKELFVSAKSGYWFWYILIPAWGICITWMELGAHWCQINLFPTLPTPHKLNRSFSKCCTMFLLSVYVLSLWCFYKPIIFLLIWASVLRTLGKKCMKKQTASSVLRHISILSSWLCH